MRYLRNMFNQVRNWFRRRTFFVILDPNDNSVTLSKSLFKHMGVMELDKAQVFVFNVPYTGDYGFTLNPDLGDVETQLADIQYNDKHHCVGFECLVPTVNRIMYDYHMQHDKRCKLSVEVCRVHDMTYYRIRRPHDKHLRKYSQG